jgi:hypothetical protein
MEVVQPNELLLKFPKVRISKLQSFESQNLKTSTFSKHIGLG